MVDIKAKVVAYASTIKTIAKNVLEFADATALMVVSVYAIIQSLQHAGFWYKGLLVSGVLLALQAFILLVKHFNKA